jgi:O-antigen ligase
MGCFVLVMLGTTVLRSGPGDFLASSLYFGDVFLLPFTYYLLAKHLRFDDGAMRVLHWSAIASVVCLGIPGVFELATGVDVLAAPMETESQVEQAFFRSNGPYSTTAIYAGVMSILFFVVQYGLMATRVGRKGSATGTVVSVAAYGLAGVGVLATMVRMSLAALAAGWVSRALFVKRALTKIIAVGFLLATVFAVGQSCYRSTELYADRVSSVETSYARLATWKTAISDLLPRYSLLGAGFGAYRETQAALRQVRWYKGVEPVDEAHNGFLELAVEGGIAGVLVFTALLAALLGQVWRFCRATNDPEDVELGAAMFGIWCVYVFPSFTVSGFSMPEVNSLFFGTAGVLAGRMAGSKPPSGKQLRGG